MIKIAMICKFFLAGGHLLYEIQENFSYDWERGRVKVENYIISIFNLVTPFLTKPSFLARA
jgi:hypothetical protein